MRHPYQPPPVVIQSDHISAARERVRLSHLAALAAGMNKDATPYDPFRLLSPPQP